MHNPQDLVIQALTKLSTDDLFNVCIAFQKQEVKPEHQEKFIDEFLKRRRQVNDAIHWVKAQPFCETQLGE